MTSSLRSIRLLLSMAWRFGRTQSVLATLEAFGNFLGHLLPLALGLLVTGIATRRPAETALGGTLLVLGSGAAPLLTTVGVEARLGLMERIGHEFDRRVATLLGSVPTLEHLDSKDIQDQAQVIKEQEGVLGSAYNTLLNALNGLVVPVAALVVALLSDARLLLLVPASLPGMLATRWIVKWDEAAEQAGAEPARLSHHLLEVATTGNGGAELRVLGAREPIRRLLQQVTVRWRSGHLAASTRTTAVSLAATTVYMATAAAVLWWIMDAAVTGRVAAGVAATAVLAVNQVQGAAASARQTYVNLARVVRTTGRYLWIETEVERLIDRHRGTATPPVRLQQGIRLEGVSFRYADAGEMALTDVNLFLPAGAVVALVGESGAGKSTLVKILTGLCQPSEGGVVVDGQDYREFDIGSWYGRCAGAFQDHLHLELTVQDAVGVGDIPHHSDTDRVMASLGAAAAVDVVERLPHRLATRLGASWPGGTDLSGGQWQKLSLARGMMRDEPLLLVLDEPTAALDALAEHEVFTRHAAAARATKHRGGITLLVTHRFSTVSAADLVIVISGGRIVEQGGHDELLRAGGNYAELYKLQAAAYA
jgi:ATP-binding cassette subfamily B protein